MIEETLDIGFGSASDDNLEPRNLCSGIGQGSQDTWATFIVATLVECINHKNECVIWMARKGTEEAKEKRAIDQLWSEVRVVMETLCYNGSQRGDDHGEFVDESRKDVDRFAQFWVISPAEKGSSKVVSFVESFAD